MRIGKGVAVGQDGWLYWVGRAREVEAFYGDTAASRRVLARWARLIGGRARRLDALGIRHLHTIIPDKLAVYPEQLGRPFPGPARPACYPPPRVGGPGQRRPDDRPAAPAPGGRGRRAGLPAHGY